jgi:hypothetical protein
MLRPFKIATVLERTSDAISVPIMESLLEQWFMAAHLPGTFSSVRSFDMTRTKNAATRGAPAQGFVQRLLSGALSSDALETTRERIKLSTINY